MGCALEPGAAPPRPAPAAGTPAPVVQRRIYLPAAYLPAALPALYQSRGFEQDGVYFELHADAH